MIDKKPAVGRYVLRLSDSPESWIDREWIGKITAVNGKTVTFLRHLEGFHIPATESRKLLDWKVAAVCDTKEEVQTLLDKSEECCHLYWEYLRNRTATINKVFGD